MIENSEQNGQAKVDEVLGLARLLFLLQEQVHGLWESTVDGAFFLTFFDPNFMPRVKKIRQQLWQAESPPLVLDLSKLHAPFGENASIVPYCHKGWTDTQHQWFSDQTISLQRDFGITNLVEDTILYGVPSLLKYMNHYEEVGLLGGETYLELRFFSARIKSKHVGAFYRLATEQSRIHVTGLTQERAKQWPHIECRFEQAEMPLRPCIVIRAYPPWPKPRAVEDFYSDHIRPKTAWMKKLYCGSVTKPMPTRGRPRAKQRQVEQIRTWTVFTMERMGGIPIRQAIRRFNQAFPDQAYWNFDTEDSEGTTQDAEGQYQRERILLLGRMPFLRMKNLRI